MYGPHRYITDRRGLLTAGIAVIGSGIGGCLESDGGTVTPPDSAGGSDPTDNGPDGTGDGSTQTNWRTRFEVVDVDTADVEESVTVAFESGAVHLSGTIRGSNTCYTARLGSVTTEDGALHVAVESYEDDEKEGCRDAIVGINYRVTIEGTDGRPEAVTVEHNGERIPTEQPY